MPQLILPITTDGLCVDARVNLDANSLASLQASGQPVPSSIQAKGLIDTGTDISVVAASILQQLGVPVHSQRTTQGIGGPLRIRLFQDTIPP
jgi:hypothetical protein